MTTHTTQPTPGAFLAELPVGSYVRTSDLPGSPEAAKAAVSRAARKGLLLPVARGLYYKGAPTRYGMVAPSAEEVALELVQHRGAGPAGVSAARALGLTTQVPAAPQVAVVGRVPSSVRGVCMTKRNNMARVELNYTEIAVLEALRVWRTTVDGGWAALVAAFRERVATGDVRKDKLVRASASEHNRAVKDGLRELIEASSLSMAA